MITFLRAILLNIIHVPFVSGRIHNFRSVKSIENRSLYSSYSIKENVTFIYSINNLEI